MPWKCVPLPTDPHGKPALHDTSVYRAVAKGANDGALEQAFLARVAHLSAEKHLDLGVLHGDGTKRLSEKSTLRSHVVVTAVPPYAWRSSKGYHHSPTVSDGLDRRPRGDVAAADAAGPTRGTPTCSRQARRHEHAVVPQPYGLPMGHAP